MLVFHADVVVAPETLAEYRIVRLLRHGAIAAGGEGAEIKTNASDHSALGSCFLRYAAHENVAILSPLVTML